MQSKIKVGDIVLAHKHSFLGHLIDWKLNGVYSHVAPVLNEYGTTLEMHPFSKIRFESVKRYFDGRHKIIILRPTLPLSQENSDKATSALHYIQKMMSYDILSLFGFVVNSSMEDRFKVNCAEGTLRMYHGIEMFTERDYDRVSPQTFYEWWKAGLFEVIYKNDKPRDNQWKALGIM